jgi:hypothetical protein
MRVDLCCCWTGDVAGHRAGTASQAQAGFTRGDRGVEHCDYPETGVLPAPSSADEAELLEASSFHSQLHEKLKARCDVRSVP